jgi:transposase
MTKRKTTHYPSEFKESSAKLAVGAEVSIAQTAENLGLNVSTLHGWVKKYYPSKQYATKALSQDASREELKLLKKENVTLRQERDILKKAAAYFAREIK